MLGKKNDEKNTYFHDHSVGLGLTPDFERSRFERKSVGVNINKKGVSVVLGVDFLDILYGVSRTFLKLQCFGGKKGFFRRREGFLGGKNVKSLSAACGPKATGTQDINALRLSNGRVFY